MPNKNLIADLDQRVTGTEDYHLHNFRRLVYTDGIKQLCEEGGNQGAYWIVDAIASHQSDTLDRKSGGFQVWILKKKGDGATLTCQADTGTPFLVKQEIEYTDFFKHIPETEIKIYVEGTGVYDSKTGNMGRVCMWPAER
jgi:hypothetical protein